MMKIGTVVLTAVAASVFAVSNANAEPFDGTRYIYSALAGSDKPRQSVTASVEHFNDRGQNYIVDAPAGSTAQKPIISLSDKTVHGWNS